MDTIYFFSRLFIGAALLLLPINVGNAAGFVCKETFFEEESLQTIQEKFSVYNE